jgi:phospholipase/carboxylesterase
MILGLLLGLSWPQEVQTLSQGEAGEQGPLILAIHGLGDKPASFKRLLEPLEGPFRALVPAAPTPYSVGYSWFDARVKSGDLEKLSSGIAHSAAMLASLLEAEAPEGDAIICGFSQGGYMSLAVATAYPDSVSKAVSMGGGLPEPLWPRDVPAEGPELVILHGTADAVVPIEPTLAAAAHLKALGWDTEVHTYEGVGHSISAEMRSELYAELRER